jgi:hypothetical protein
MRRSLLVAVAVLLTAVPVAAQTPVVDRQGTPAVETRSMADGMVAGQMLANTRGTGGSFVGGLAGGLVLGLIGTGIAYAAQGPSELPVSALAESQKYGSEYLLGVQQGFADRSKAKKRSSALTGGLLGTAAFVALVLSASGS